MARRRNRNSSRCLVPGCKMKTKTNDKSSTFLIKRPEFARTKEGKDHRLFLTRFALSLRDSTRGDAIKQMLHKESASICERHFDEDDITLNKRGKSLKYGAVPRYFLPKIPSHCKSKPRKPPVQRTIPSRIRHKTLASVEQSYARLSSRLKEQWSFLRKNSFLSFELRKSRDQVQPSLSITIGQDLTIQDVAFTGWICRSLDDFKVCDLRLSTLAAFLEDLEKYKICRGVQFTTEYTPMQFIQTLTEDHLEFQCLSRHSECIGFVSCDASSTQCCFCLQHDAKKRRCKDTKSLNVPNDANNCTFHFKIIKPDLPPPPQPDAIIQVKTEPSPIAEAQPMFSLPYCKTELVEDIYQPLQFIENVAIKHEPKG